MSERDPWTDHAACADMPKAVFFPTGANTTEYQNGVRAAVAVCDGCPVRQSCFDAAMGRGEVWGVWGGHDFRTTPNTATRDAEIRRLQARLEQLTGHGGSADWVDAERELVQRYG